MNVHYRNYLRQWRLRVIYLIYVDDFIGLVQGNQYHRQHVKSILLASLDEVLL
jgi:hypothetical protein